MTHCCKRPIRWLYRVFLATCVLGTNMAHGKTKNMAFLILKSFFRHSFSDILKIRNITSFYSLSCGPLSHLRSRQELRSLTNKFTRYSIVLFVSSSTLQLWAWKISTEAATIVPSAGNCHSKCHLCRGRGFELLRKQGKLFRTTRWSPSSSRSTSPRVTYTARILAAFVKHFQDRP